MSNRKQRKPLPYTPNTYSSMREQGSPTKATILLQQDHAAYILSLEQRKDTFCTCLDLYKISFQNQMPQKCFKHNNFITLYCDNESKLLCVNCIYGSAIHKDHRVLPSKNSIPSISQDNSANLKALEEELDKIKSADIEIRSNKKVLEEEQRAIIREIDEEFKRIYEMIKRKQAETKARVFESFDSAIKLNDLGMKQVIWWRQILTKTKSTFPKQSTHQDSEIYKHLVLDLFMKQKMDEEKLTYLPSGQQIRTQFVRQITNLRELIENEVGATKNSTQKGKMRIF